MRIEEVALLGFVTLASFKLLSAEGARKNQGELDTTVVAANAAQEAQYASADGVKARSPEPNCAVPAPMMLSTSLLPSTTKPLGDDAFQGISPDALQAVNFMASGWSLGRDTQTNTMRNPSWDLRSEPVNPSELTPANNSFLNTTMAAPTYERKFEIAAVSKDGAAAAAPDAAVRSEDGVFASVE